MGTRILSFGGGVDSTAILAHHLFVESLNIEHVVFADTGAEFPETYLNIQLFKTLCEESGIPFHIISKGGETIIEWCTRLGVVPLMPGGSHVCSKKFKGDVIRSWTGLQGIEDPVYLIGIEANESHRLNRFNAPKGDTAVYEYPLVEMGMDRESCDAFLKSLGFNVKKSSCMICPYMSPQEIQEAMSDPITSSVIKDVENQFRKTSRVKHERWIESGKPLNKGGRAPIGMWRRDSWDDGQRLFAARHKGRTLSVEEWEQLPRQTNNQNQLCFQM